MYIEDFYKPIVERFFKQLINEIKELNSYRDDKTKLNIPFLIAPLAQDINLHFEKYTDFAEDIRDIETVGVEVINNDGYEQVRANIWIEENEKYYYQILFDSNPVYSGYCECKPTDNGYREDKQCCGYGCDWDEPTVKVSKVLLISDHDWEGTEHEYWDFEDEFYDKDDKAKNEKHKRENKIRANFLQSEIKRMQKELENLENL
nr:hypothetical protein [uncultured Lachnoclostridium sp.]